MQFASGNCSEESCGAYLDGEVELIESVRPSEATVDTTQTEYKESVSEPMIITPTSQCSFALQTVSKATPESPMEKDTTESTGPKAKPVLPSSTIDPAIRFLWTLRSLQLFIRQATGATSQKTQVLGSPLLKLSLVPTHRMVIRIFLPPGPTMSIRAESAAQAPLPNSSSEAEEIRETDFESDANVRSTMYDALVSPTKIPSSQFGQNSSETFCNSSPVKEAGPEPFSRSSRPIIKQYSSEVTPFSLPQGHPTIALNESQICSILRVVTNESARASFDMLNSVIHPRG